MRKKDLRFSLFSFSPLSHRHVRLFGSFIIFSIEFITIFNRFELFFVKRSIDKYRRVFFSREIDRNFVFVQIRYVSEPENPIWAIIMIKQCCGIDSNQIDSSSKEFRWFRQPPILIFCPEISIDRNLIETFEKASRMTFAPRGPCLRAIEIELKIELISASIVVGLAVFIVLFSWLFFYQNSRKHWNFFKLKRKKARRQSSKKHSSILSAASEISSPKQLETPILEEKSMPIVTKTVANKKAFKEFVRPSDDFRD